MRLAERRRLGWERTYRHFLVEGFESLIREWLLREGSLKGTFLLVVGEDVDGVFYHG